MRNIAFRLDAISQGIDVDFRDTRRQPHLGDAAVQHWGDENHP